MSRAVLIMAGGTGGHVYPALAVAECLRRQGVPLFWLGTQRGLEARVVPQRGIELLTISIAGLRGKGLATRLLAPARMLLALWQSLRLLMQTRPVAVLGMGGFVSGPGGLAAWLLRVPLLIHEQNAIPGLTNRLLAPFAWRVMEAFPGSMPARWRALHTGNPVREEILALPQPARRMATRKGGMRLLVLGGSQGARCLNEVLPRAVAACAGERIWVRHQSGGSGEGPTRDAYLGLGVEAQVTAFIEDMAEAYAWADLVVCRAGAMTIAELTAVGVGAVLVPYPHAVDDHQRANAIWLYEAGAALMFSEGEALERGIAALLRELAVDAPRRLRMAEAARALACPDAARLVAGECLRAGGLAHG